LIYGRRFETDVVRKKKREEKKRERAYLERRRDGRDALDVELAHDQHILVDVLVQTFCAAHGQM
jgi:predicted RNA polymerase sigma factor